MTTWTKFCPFLTTTYPLSTWTISKYTVHIYQNYEGINMVMACKIKLYYSELDLKYVVVGFISV